MSDDNLRPVIEHFEREGYRFEAIARPRELRTSFRCTNGVHRLRVIDCNGALVFQVPGLLFAGPAHREALLSRLAALNYGYVLGRWGCDPTDGEVSMDYVIPPQPHPVTEEQIRMAMGIVINEADRYQPELQLINLLGHVPEGALPSDAPQALPDGPPESLPEDPASAAVREELEADLLAELGFDGGAGADGEEDEALGAWPPVREE